MTATEIILDATLLMQSCFIGWLLVRVTDLRRKCDALFDIAQSAEKVQALSHERLMMLRKAVERLTHLLFLLKQQNEQR